MSAAKILLGYHDAPGEGRLVEEAIKRAKGREALVYVVTSMPLVSRTLATFRRAEFGFFGVVV